MIAGHLASMRAWYGRTGQAGTPVLTDERLEDATDLRGVARGHVEELDVSAQASALAPKAATSPDKAPIAVNSASCTTCNWRREPPRVRMIAPSNTRSSRVEAIAA